MQRAQRQRTGFDRRTFLLDSALAIGALGLGAGACIDVRDGEGSVRLDMQLGWLAGGNQLGEVAAARLGFFDDEGIDLRIHPGGPNTDGIGIVASGRYRIGQAASSPSVMLAISQGIPIQCFAVGVQQHPYTYFSLEADPVRAPLDLIGKRVGVQQTGRILLDALLEAHRIDDAELEIVVVGSSLIPLLTGQVDVITGWSTNATALRQLGEDPITMSLWEAGVRLYASPYYATRSTIERHHDVLAAFLRAAARGWELAFRDTERAVELLIDEYPILRFDDELRAARRHLEYVFTDATLEGGWGTMSVEAWEHQIALYTRLGQFRQGAPTVDQVMTLSLLEETMAARPRLGRSALRSTMGTTPT